VRRTKLNAAHTKKISDRAHDRSDDAHTDAGTGR
jgi:hypothetical protein